MSEDKPPIKSHPFQPYAWDESRCGYIDGDDMMCGFAEEDHENK